jgi:hypothetical protein
VLVIPYRSRTPPPLPGRIRRDGVIPQQFGDLPDDGGVDYGAGWDDAAELRVMLDVALQQVSRSGQHGGASPRSSPASPASSPKSSTPQSRPCGHTTPGYWSRPPGRARR